MNRWIVLALICGLPALLASFVIAFSDSVGQSTSTDISLLYATPLVVYLVTYVSIYIHCDEKEYVSPRTFMRRQLLAHMSLLFGVFIITVSTVAQPYRMLLQYSLLFTSMVLLFDIPVYIQIHKASKQRQYTRTESTF